MQCVAVCCSVSQSVLQCMLHSVAACCIVCMYMYITQAPTLVETQEVAVCCSVL